MTFKWSGTQQTTISGGGYEISAGSSGSGSFQGDNYYLGGSSNTSSTTDTIDTSGVNSPAPQSVYQNDRYGNFSYVFPGLTAGTSYTVSLLFAETYWSSSGQRVFNVSANGSQVLSNFDIVAATGAKDKAIIKQFNATADNNGQITIQFNSVVNYAKVGGLMIVPTNGTITVDDSVQGSGLNQFNYVGNGWSHCSNCDTNNYGYYTELLVHHMALVPSRSMVGLKQCWTSIRQRMLGTQCYMSAQY